MPIASSWTPSSFAVGYAAIAEREFRQAIEIAPTYARASVNLADLYRRLDREQDADAALRGALRQTPREAVLHHALGLSLVRQQRKGEACSPTPVDPCRYCATS